MTETITLENNALEISYSEKEPDTANFKILNKNISGIYYKENLMTYPYLSTQNTMLKLDDKEGLSNLKPFKFLIQESEGEMANFNYMPHNFIFNQNLDKATIGERVFEIRVKNEYGEWQDWQAIIGEFTIYKVIKQGNKIYLCFPIKTFIKELNDFFEIRYSGLLNISNFGDAQIISDDDIKQINLNTWQIEFFADSGNPCNPFEDRVKDWREFESKYYVYDEDGKRL
jgi:hypothetical protein